MTDSRPQSDWDDLSSDEIASIDSGDLYHNRPNRWTGPQSTWRHLTEQDRLLWQSMTRLRDQDLAVHLYNAHALKRQGREPEGARFLTIKTDSGQDAIWQPPRAWTAWPLKPSELPMEDFLHAKPDADDAFTFRKPFLIMPSAGLEAELNAHILRRAKKRFYKYHARHASLPEDRDVALQSTEMGDDHEQQQQQQQQQRLSDEGEPASPVSATSSTWTRTVKEESVPARAMADLHLHTDAGTEPDSKKRKRRQGSQSLGDHAERPHGQVRDYEPRVMEDDEVAESLLRQPVRHILTKLDQTLDILHHGRVAAVRNLDESSDDDENRDDIEGKRKKKMSGSDKRRGRPAKSRDTPRGEARDESAAKADWGKLPKAGAQLRSDMHAQTTSATASEEEEEDEDAAFEAWLASESKPDPEAATRDTFQRDRSRLRRREEGMDKMGLRDWSDVLGAAALAGFPEDIIARTAQRCATLFGEQMLIRRIGEGSAQVEERTYRTGSAPLQSSEDESRAVERVSWIGGTKSATPSRTVSSTRREAADNDQLRCPIVSCKRHRKPFPRINNLTRHMKEVHGESAAASRATSRAASAGSGHDAAMTEGGDGDAKGQEEDEARSANMVLPSVKDTRRAFARLCCAIPSCPRAAAAFPKRSNLKRHMRDLHGWEGLDPPTGVQLESAAVASSSRTDQEGQDVGDGCDDQEAPYQADGEYDARMVGGVQVDGFLEPIVLQARVRGRDVKKRKPKRTAKVSRAEEASDED